jgi:alpha-D-ribose 1-methylphosphonate 5-triphosphate diphosphatase
MDGGLKMSNRGTWICNAQVVLPNETAKGNVYIENKIIKIIDFEPERTKIDSQNHDVINGEGMLLLPGLIDLHCDAIEKEVEPRPNTFFPMNLALYELEKKLAAEGITTMYHSLSLGVGLSLRGDHLMRQLLEQIHRYRLNQRTMIRHRIHLRYEITHFDGQRLAEDLIQDDKVDYFSFMNHAPGQGQYKLPGSFEAYVMKNQGVNKEEVKEIVENVIRKQDDIDWTKLKEFTRYIASKGIVIASHDDDSCDQVDVSKQIGATVVEFPLNLETSAYAMKQNMAVCVGAPNIIRGGSHDKNMKALDAVKAGSAEILCSDYSPSSLLPAVFKLVDEGIPLSDAVNMASLHPAKALGLDKEFGSIEVGKKADLILVEQIEGYPSIRKTIVNGHVVYQSEFFLE